MEKEREIVHRVSVSILGEQYTIRGAADPGYISEVADLVDTRMRELRATSAGKFGMTRLAILTAINLADELLQQKQGKSDNQEIEKRTHRLITLLDEGLIGDSPEL